MFFSLEFQLWCLVGNGGMDPYYSPQRSLIVIPITRSGTIHTYKPLQTPYYRRPIDPL